MAMNSKTTQPSPGTVNLARAFYEHVESLRAFTRAGSLINPRTMNVEMLENLLQFTDNAGHILRGLINGCRPINRLPYEVLAAIFSLVPQPHPHATRLATFSSHKMVKISDLLAITSTCRHWREAALASSSLWSTVVETKGGIPGQPPSRTHSLDRCPTGPLRFLIAPPVSQRMLSTLAEQSSRTSEIVVIVADSHLATIVSTPLPALQHCCFGHCHSTTPTVVLFPGGCPRLKTLSLEQVNFVPSTGFSSLTHLHMSYPIGFGGVVYTLREVFAFISECSNLRTMFFEGPPWGFAVNESEGYSRPIVPLYHLERLVIIEHHLRDYEPEPQDQRMAFLRTFFARVSIPSSCVIRLGGVPLVDLSYCTDLIGFTDNPTSWRIFKGDNNAIFTGHTQVVSIQVLSPMDGRYLWLDLMTTPLIALPMDDEILQLSTALAQSPIFTNARKVWIDPGFAWLLSTGPEPLLSHMAQLESLIVCRDAKPVTIRESGILQALEIKTTGSTPEGAAPAEDRDPAIACPRLATLRVDCLTDEDAVYVLQLAASRATAGLPFERVILGRTFRGRSKVCMLHQYDGGGEVVKVGDTRSDALWAHWMSQLSPICLDESEDCEPYWRSWRWDP